MKLKVENVVKTPEGDYAAIIQIIDNVAMVLPWNSGKEKMYRLCELTFLKERDDT